MHGWMRRAGRPADGSKNMYGASYGTVKKNKRRIWNERIFGINGTE